MFRIGSVDMVYDDETIKKFFEFQKNTLEKLITQNIEIKNSITTLEEMLNKENDLEKKEKIQGHINTVKTTLALNEISINATITLMNSINQLAISSGFQSLYTPETQKIVDTLTADNTLEVSIEMIYQKFEEIKLLFNAYTNETDLIKKEEILKQFNSKKNELSSLKSKLSCRMRKLKKTNQITEEDFKKFKEDQIKYNKEHYELYAKINEEQTKENVEKQEKEHENIEEHEIVEEQEKIEEHENVAGKTPKIDETITYGNNPNRMKNSKVADTMINKIQNAVSTHENFKKVSAEGNIKETKKALKEDKKAQRKISMARNPELLKQRDRLAMELSELGKMYGTANNNEYQIRLQQLKELDKKIFGHKAKRIYKDFKKPINMIGGTYIELPKAYIDIRLESLGKQR